MHYMVKKKNKEKKSKKVCKINMKNLKNCSTNTEGWPDNFYSVIDYFESHMWNYF